MTTLLTLTTKDERLQLLRNTVKPFSTRAADYDRNNQFPFENIEALKAIKYPAIGFSPHMGGLGISLVELLKMQQTIAEVDGSTALAIGWHIGITFDLSETNSWPVQPLKSFTEDVIANGALINNAASEPETGSPTRGGKPKTTATKTESGWKLNGRKIFTTLAPVLDYFIVSASIINPDISPKSESDNHSVEIDNQVVNFLVKRSYQGVSIDKTWNSLSMRATGSHDLILENVLLPPDALLEKADNSKPQGRGWLLHIPVIYHGISIAAYRYALDFAKTYSPNSLASGTIAQFPLVQQKIGLMRLKILQNEHFLYSVAQKWDKYRYSNNIEDNTISQQIQDELGAVKVAVVNNGIEIIDNAMRLVGAKSLSLNNPLQRYYRDIRAGLHNPPMEDRVLISLAQSVL